MIRLSKGVVGPFGGLRGGSWWTGKEKINLRDITTRGKADKYCIHSFGEGIPKRKLYYNVCLNSLGVIPATFLNTRLNVLISSKPLSSAISWIDRSPRCNNFCAYLIRYEFT